MRGAVFILTLTGGALVLKGGKFPNPRGLLTGTYCAKPGATELSGGLIIPPPVDTLVTTLGVGAVDIAVTVVGTTIAFVATVPEVDTTTRGTTTFAEDTAALTEGGATTGFSEIFGPPT